MLTISVCTLILEVAAVYSESEITDMFKIGFGNIQKETINGETTVENGHIPTWLSGDFMRHACGAFGEVDNMNDTLPNYIGHLFDCLGIGTKFRLEAGKVTFTQRWYKSTVDDIYNFYGKNMNNSSTFMRFLFSQSNRDQIDKWHSKIADRQKVSQVPHIGWWKVGNDAVAMTENPLGVIVDTGDVTQKGSINYKDTNIRIPETPQHGYVNNPAHEEMEQDGTLWSALVVSHFVSKTRLKSRRLVYKIDMDKSRQVVGAYDYEDADLRKCKEGVPYPDFNARFGYLHSFSMTENYVILPETGYMHDPCYYASDDKYGPYFQKAFYFEPQGLTRLLVMRKSDGVFIANIVTMPIFITHQLGSYEDGELIHMDMLTYENADIYSQYSYVKNLMEGDSYSTNVSRITINMTDQTASMRSLRKPGSARAALEMPNINHLFNGRKYKYAYMTRNFIQKERNAILKLNVDTGEETEYEFPYGMYVQEPHFIPRPDTTAEDDGVIIAHGVDGRKRKAFMVIVEASNMTLIGHVTAPDIALFGLHSRFYPLKATNGVQNITEKSSLLTTIFICLLFSLLVQLLIPCQSFVV